MHMPSWNFNKQKQFARGLTLVELIVAISLLGLVGLGFGALYSTAQRYMVQKSGSKLHTVCREWNRGQITSLEKPR